MERKFTESIIYRVIKYSDNSAIAFSFSKEYGKLKLFIPKAYSKKNGILSFVPGEIDFLKKDNSDLNKLYSFRPNPNYKYFIEEPIIYLRLTLIFDVFDNLYDVSQKEDILWNMILRLRQDNVYNATIFIIYTLLKKSGYMFEFYHCQNCGCEINGNATLIDGFTYCKTCKNSGYIKINTDDLLILKALNNTDLYKKLKITLRKELSILEIFIKHIEVSTGKGLKSFSTFKSLVSSL